MPSMCTRCLLYAHVAIVLICAFHFHLFFLYFFLSVLFCLPSLSPVVCENREESWSWFQYLWRHQWPGEPLQTLWYGTTRPSLPTSHSPPSFFPQSCHGNCCSSLQCFVSLSLCVSVCGAAVDLVNSESANLENQSLFDTDEGIKIMMRDHTYAHWSDMAGNLTRDWENVMLWFCYWYTCSKWLGVCWGERSPRPPAYGVPS